MADRERKSTVSWTTRIGWGFGGLAGNYMVNALNVLFLVLYADYLKMPPVLAGLALALPRFFDAITDPLIGNLSDNSRTRWGRRKPFMVVGVVLSAVLLPLFWTPPGTGTVMDTEWFRNIPFLYATVLGMIYALTYTLFDVPYTALGYELTDDYDERTRVLAWRMYIGLFGSMTVPLLYQFCQWDPFGNVLSGARWVSILLGIIVIMTGLLPVVFTQEHKEVIHQDSIPFLKAVRYTLSNVPFLILIVAYVIIIVGLFSAGNLGLFLNIYYICGANRDFAGIIGSVVGVFGAVMSYASMFLIAAVSRKLSKKAGMILGLVLALISAVGSWWTLDPRWPLMQLVTMTFATLGLQGCWLMVSSMVADICDEDELRSGLRREGMFGAVNGFALKAALALTALVGGVLLQTSGFDADAQQKFLSQTRENCIASVETLEIADDPFETFRSRIFRPAGEKLVALAEDRAAPEGSRRTIFWRMLKGEKVYFTLYDFERVVIETRDRLEGLVRGLENPRSGKEGSRLSELQSALAAQQQFLDGFGKQKAVSLLMKKLIVIFQCIGLIIALSIFAFYPITRERAAETRRILDERNRR
jgi:glycoside/pentoside/hexuronide:cation symporter, GPH family